MQENWIGRSVGARVTFPLQGRDDGLEIFTTRPDTLFGASFCAVSPDHPLAEEIGRANPAVAEFVAECRRSGTSEAAIETQEKRGIDTGLRAVHPLDPNVTVPVYVANFVLMEYGTGAIFGCPAHDQRDFDFARAYGLPIIPVLWPAGEARPDGAAMAEAMVTDRWRLRLRAGPADARSPAVGGRGQGHRHRRPAAAQGGRGDGALPAARLGRVAPALLGLPDPDHPLRRHAASCRCRRTSCR